MSETLWKGDENPSPPANWDSGGKRANDKQIRKIFDKMFEELRVGTVELLVLRENNPERAVALTVAMNSVLKAADAVIRAEEIAVLNNKKEDDD